MTTQKLIKCLRHCASLNDCGDCSYHERGCMNSMMNEAADTIERLTNERGWISVTERLPRVYDPVFVCWKNGLGVDYYSGERNDAGLPLFMIAEGKVTHWMPFQKPPREEDSHE